MRNHEIECDECGEMIAINAATWSFQYETARGLRAGSIHWDCLPVKSVVQNGDERVEVRDIDEYVRKRPDFKGLAGSKR